MFKIHRQPQGENAVKKSIHKLLDPKKDVITRLKHLRNVLDNSSEYEIQSMLELYYSQVYYIFFENFLIAESNLRLKGSHRAQREELDSILILFQLILTNLPSLIHQRWQYHSIDMVIKRLLHTQNSFKVRREGMQLFLLWLRALGDNALPKTLLLYACLVPGFPPPLHSDGKPYSLEWLVNKPINEEVGVHQVEIMCLVAPPSSEKTPTNTTKYFLDALLEFMVLKSRAIKWKEYDKDVKCFSFVWDLFKRYYLIHAFPDYDKNTTIYGPTLGLPEPRDPVTYLLSISDNGSYDEKIDVADCAMLEARVSILKWIVAFTGKFERTEPEVIRPDSTIEALQRQVLKQLQELNISQEDKLSTDDAESKTSSKHSSVSVPPHSSMASIQHDNEISNSNTSTLTEKEPSISSLSSLDDKLRSSATAEEEIVRKVFYSTRENVNIIHEIFRQCFILPLTEVPTMRRVVKVYQEWIQEGDLPVFMQESSDTEDMFDETEEVDGQDLLGVDRQNSLTNLRNVSYVKGQLNPLIDQAFSMHVKAGSQSTYQLFVTNSAYIFLVESPKTTPKLIQAQVDVCKRVLNLYRYMVMNVFLSDSTWQQLLRILLHVTRVMLQQAKPDEPETLKYQTVAGRLAAPVFQTLIVSWIKANLFVKVSRELWDELVEVLSSLTHWEELVVEWAKNMETMTRVLARHVYKLELQDLPLDRLTEQKHKKQRRHGAGNKTTKPGLLTDRSFSRGWSRETIPSTTVTPPDAEDRRKRSKSSFGQSRSVDEGGGFSQTEPSRQRSASMIPAETIQAKTVPAQRGVSDSEFPTNSNSGPDGGNTMRRRNSASDINTATGNEMSPVRHRCDSEGQQGEKSNDTTSIESEGLRVGWVEKKNVYNYPRDSNSEGSMEADCMFDELIQERLHHDNEKDSTTSENWPNEVTSLHSQDSASIDPDWNPWSSEFQQGHQNKSNTIIARTPQVNSSESPAELRSGFTPEDSPPTVTPIVFPDPSNPPAIPARKALPPAVQLCDIDFLTPSTDNSSVDFPYYDDPFLTCLDQDQSIRSDPELPQDNTDASHHSPAKLPPNSCNSSPQKILNASPTNPFKDDTVSPDIQHSELSLSPGHDKGDSVSPSKPPTNPPNSLSKTLCDDSAPENTENLSPANAKVPGNSVEEPVSDGSLLTSPPYQLYQNTSNYKNDSSGRLLPEETPVPFLVPDDSFNSTNSPEHSSSQDKTLDLPNSSLSVEDVVSVATYEEEDDLSTIAESNEEDTLATSADDILLQHCSTPQPGMLNVSNKKNFHLISQTAIDDPGIDEENSIQEEEERSIMAGGKKTGWYQDVAVALWRRLLGVLGDVNVIEDPYIHELVFRYLLELWEILYKMKQNIGVSTDSATSIPHSTEQLVPPLKILAPWSFKAAVGIPDSHKGGKLYAFQLLCKMTIQNDNDIPLEPDHLAQFYAVLHECLHSTDQDIMNEIVGTCGHYFSSDLPALTLLLLDFLYACHKVAASPDLKAPRVAAQTILGSTLCFPNLYHNIPVLKPDSVNPESVICNNLKDYVVETLLTSGKKEPSASARCVALSSTGLWLYEELTTGHTRHPRVKEAINVLLVSLKFNNRTVASVACSQLHLLTHCSQQLLDSMPEITPRIIEVMSLTVSALLNGTEAKNTDSGRQLLVSLLWCILDWCMSVPVELLTDTDGPESDKRLIRTVFKALQAAALGKPGHSAKHSYSLSDLKSQDFDPNLELDKVQEQPGLANILNRAKNSMARNSNKISKDGPVSLAAQTVLSHLTNHLGHFPLSHGTSVLTSRVSENHDGDSASDELSAELFNSPNIQFLIFNDTCLLSVMELPTAENPTSGGSTAGMITSNKCVRFIVRDAGGKYCWDSHILFAPPNVKELTDPVNCEPLSLLDEEISRIVREKCQSYLDYSITEENTKRKVDPTPLIEFDKPESCKNTSADKLDQMLQYIGWSSPECQKSIGSPLNVPSLPPLCVSGDLLLNTTNLMLKHHQQLGENYSQQVIEKRRECRITHPPPPVENPPEFYYARLLCSELGFLSRESRDRVNLMKKNERLLRELKNLDARHCRETHKVAVLYISEGQEEKLPILSNSQGSKEYEAFVAGLGWEVDLSTHCGYHGKLDPGGTTGKSAPYYATSSIEVIYHVATRFPSHDENASNVKLKHIGNDEVHIIWSEHYRDYRRGIIPTEFGDVLIVIYPMRHGLYRIQVIQKPDVPYFGPLFNGAVVNARVLPILVRETAINAGRAKRSQISLYQPFYEERSRYLRQIIEQFKDERTFEDYSARLFCPVPKSVPTVKPAHVDSQSPAPGTTSVLNGNNNSAAPTLDAHHNKQHSSLFSAGHSESHHHHHHHANLTSSTSNDNGAHQPTITTRSKPIPILSPSSLFPSSRTKPPSTSKLSRSLNLGFSDSPPTPASAISRMDISNFMTNG